MGIHLADVKEQYVNIGIEGLQAMIDNVDVIFDLRLLKQLQPQMLIRQQLVARAWMEIDGSRTSACCMAGSRPASMPR